MPMETTDRETPFERVVRLKVDGSSTAVNTLRDQQTARGISLVCPFPALEVDIPVRFGQGRNSEMSDGSIHRISVEDDPETGLPRLRLSIRSRDPRTVALGSEKSPERTPFQGEPQVSEIGPIQLINIRSIPSPLPDNHVSAPPLPKVIHRESSDEDYPEDQPFSVHGRAEPAWVDCDAIPAPEDFLKDRAERRGYRLAATAGAWLAMLALVVAGGYVMERTGFVDLSKVRSYFTGFSVSNSKANTPVEEGSLDLPFASHTEPPSPSSAPSATAPEDSIPQAIGLEIENESWVEINKAEPNSQPLEEATSPEEQNQNEYEEELVKPAESEEAALAATTEEDSTPKEMGILFSDVTLVLPTRWPVEYASAYRIRDPNGIVVDVPGGLVRREGWLESGTEHPMIRSIKAIQRESGARYIVYVHGTLPRFATSPKTDGVFLRLYHEIEEANSTEQIAMAQ